LVDRQVGEGGSHAAERVNVLGRLATRSLLINAANTRSSGSVGTSRRTRSTSIARLRVIVNAHVATDARRGIEHLRVPVDPNERLLSDLLGEARFSDDADGEAEEPMLVAADEHQAARSSPSAMPDSRASSDVSS
jgi:hypothetical protein